GNFKPVQPSVTGFSVMGDGKGLVRLSSVLGDLFIASQNQDSLRVFVHAAPENTSVFHPNADDTYAELVYQDGATQRIEFQYGSGYFSQSSRAIRVAPSVKSAKVFNAKGESRPVVEQNNP
ncbi:MAG: hypothetical protein HC859_16770, partial [Bacteroidia bacterium]|nr:hypothetical protein [Bacteroidia bacterium]